MGLSVNKKNSKIALDTAVPKVKKDPAYKGSIVATDGKKAILKQEIRQLITKGDVSIMPAHAKPMMATLVKESFDDAGWLFELKWDGYRAVATVIHGEVELLSRNNLSFTSRYLPVTEALQRLKINVILDGEIIILNENGISDFQQLQSWQRTGKGDLMYYVFDILWVEGYSLNNMALIERKKILEALIPEDGVIRYSDHIMQKGKAFFKLALEQGLEGIMAKKADSTYHPGIRSSQWLKIKTHRTQEAVIAGFTEGRGGRKHFGALILGMYQNNEFVYIGHTGSGLDDKGLVQVYKKLQPLITDKCPFNKKPKTNMAATWVTPQVVCEVKFQEWTNDNLLRIPIFLRLREDKKATDIIKENSVAPLALTGSRANRSKTPGQVNTLILPASPGKRSAIGSKKKTPE
ncbi:MAG: non-homologous end-joining DNA ligase [Chitinophagaceae bacterium]